MTSTTVATDMSSAGDELLRWASEAGAGAWERLRDACAYLCQKHNVQRRPWMLASDLSALGHLDIDWRTRAWSVAPPALNLVPGLGLCVVLTGSRPHHLDLRFEMATDDMDVYPFDVRQDPAPRAKYAKCASVEVARRVAERMDAHLVVDPGIGLACALRAVDEERIEAAPEPPLEEATRFDPITLRWVDNHGRKPGLYRIDLHGRPVHRRLDDFGSWWALDLAAGQFLALRERGKQHEAVMRWRPETDERPDCFEVRSQLALPILAERAMTVSSGLVPQVVAGWRRYFHVSHPLALRISRALIQDLPTMWGE